MPDLPFFLYALLAPILASCAVIGAERWLWPVSDRHRPLFFWLSALICVTGGISIWLNDATWSWNTAPGIVVFPLGIGALALLLSHWLPKHRFWWLLSLIPIAAYSSYAMLASGAFRFRFTENAEQWEWFARIAVPTIIGTLGSALLPQIKYRWVLPLHGTLWATGGAILILFAGNATLAMSWGALGAIFCLGIFATVWRTTYAPYFAVFCIPALLIAGRTSLNQDFPYFSFVLLALTPLPWQLVRLSNKTNNSAQRITIALISALAVCALFAWSIMPVARDYFAETAKENPYAQY